MGTVQPLVASVAATLPDAGDFEVVATCAILLAFLFWVVSTLSGNDRDQGEHDAFVGGMVGTAIGLAIDLVGLVTGVY